MLDYRQMRIKQYTADEMKFMRICLQYHSESQRNFELEMK